jgi:hypothetical protein
MPFFQFLLEEHIFNSGSPHHRVFNCHSLDSFSVTFGHISGHSGFLGLPYKIRDLVKERATNKKRSGAERKRKVKEERSRQEKREG